MASFGGSQFWHGLVFSSYFITCSISGSHLNKTFHSLKWIIARLKHEPNCTHSWFHRRHIAFKASSCWHKNQELIALQWMARWLQMTTNNAMITATDRTAVSFDCSPGIITNLCQWESVWYESCWFVCLLLIQLFDSCWAWLW